jgi:hypothetical protein
MASGHHGAGVALCTLTPSPAIFDSRWFTPVINHVADLEEARAAFNPLAVSGD